MKGDSEKRRKRKNVKDRKMTMTTKQGWPCKKGKRKGQEPQEPKIQPSPKKKRASEKK